MHANRFYMYVLLQDVCMLGNSQNVNTCIKLSTPQSWADIQTVLSRTGGDHPLALMADFDPSYVPRDIAEKADTIMARHSLREIRLASHGAASFHVWVRSFYASLDVGQRW